MSGLLDLGAIEARYSAALDARPSKGAEIGSDGYTALTDSVADIPALLDEVKRLRAQDDCTGCGASGYATTYDGRTLGICDMCQGSGAEPLPSTRPAVEAL